MNGFGELGSTTDPQALVWGSVETIRADAHDLRTRAGELESEADGPVSATVAAWTGQAATASTQNRAAVAEALNGVGQAYRVVAEVLEAHADVLARGQRQAQVAIDLWEQGVNEARAAGVGLFAARSRGTGLLGSRQPAFPDADPGGPARRQAEAVLAVARGEVRASQAAVARVLDELCADMPDGQFHFDQFLGGIGDWAAGIANLVWRFNNIRAFVDPDAMLDDATEMATGLWDTTTYITANPTEAVPVLFNTQLVHDNPGRWWGQMFPDIALTAAAGVGALSKAGWLARGADDLIDLAAGPYPAGSAWADAAARERWVDELLNGPDAHPQTSLEPWADYQRRVAGDWEVDLRGGGEQIRADGVAVDPDAVVAVDAKFTGSPGSSPYTGTAPPQMLDRLLRDFDDEVRRYGLVMADSSNPVARLNIVANTPESVAFLSARAERILGDGFDVVGVLQP